jgi:hypothetical protein
MRSRRPFKGGIMQQEIIYQSEALNNGWLGIGSDRTWWFDTSEEYQKRYTLDKKGIPIGWDDGVYPVEETRQCTGDNTCTIILANKQKKALVLVHKDLDHVLILGSINKKVEWEDYNSQGLWAIKKHLTEYSLDAVIINPKIKTLEKFKVVKAIIKKVIETRNLEGKDHEPAQEEDTED